MISRDAHMTIHRFVTHFFFLLIACLPVTLKGQSDEGSEEIKVTLKTDKPLFMAYVSLVTIQLILLQNKLGLRQILQEKIKTVFYQFLRLCH